MCNEYVILLCFQLNLKYKRPDATLALAEANNQYMCQ